MNSQIPPDEPGPQVQATLKVLLKKIRDALANETEENLDMIQTYIRYTQGSASADELKDANSQFKEFLKTIGLGALAILPFAPLTIPAIVKLGQKFGIEIIPKSFKSKK